MPSRFWKLNNTRRLEFIQRAVESIFFVQNSTLQYIGFQSLLTNGHKCVNVQKFSPKNQLSCENEQDLCVCVWLIASAND